MQQETESLIQRCITEVVKQPDVSRRPPDPPDSPKKPGAGPPSAGLGQAPVPYTAKVYSGGWGRERGGHRAFPEAVIQTRSITKYNQDTALGVLIIKVLIKEMSLVRDEVSYFTLDYHY